MVVYKTISVVILLYAITYFLSIPEREKEIIDVVYTWVNLTDNFDRYPLELFHKNYQRWRDNDELKYSLRSVEINMIKLIPHTLLFDDKKDLPTFNSAAIEVNLHKIPGLSEKFIYFNDDMLIGKPVQLSDFWIKDKGPVIDFHYPTPFCNEECEYKDIGDGLCHFQCLTKHCQYDFNDCTKIIDYYHYDLTCPTSLIGDGICQLECNTKYNGYDAGDCNSTHTIIETLETIEIEKPHTVYQMDHREPYLIISYEKSFPDDNFNITLENKAMIRSVRRIASQKLIYIIFFKQKHEKTQFVLESESKKYIIDVIF